MILVGRGNDQGAKKGADAGAKPLSLAGLAMKGEIPGAEEKAADESVACEVSGFTDVVVNVVPACFGDPPEEGLP